MGTRPLARGTNVTEQSAWKGDTSALKKGVGGWFPWTDLRLSGGGPLSPLYSFVPQLERLHVLSGPSYPELHCPPRREGEKLSDVLDLSPALAATCGVPLTAHSQSLRKEESHFKDGNTEAC